MSSKIQIQRICQFCGNEFTARTTVTKFCSLDCGRKAYKERKRSEKIEKSNDETIRVQIKPIELLKTKEFLSVNEASTLIGISRRTLYRLINNGSISIVKVGTRTIIKRSELDRFVEIQSTTADQQKNKEVIDKLDLSDCYTLSQVQTIFNISRSALSSTIKRNGIPKRQEGKYTYVPKEDIHKIFTKPKTLFDL